MNACSATHCFKIEKDSGLSIRLICVQREGCFVDCAKRYCRKGHMIIGRCIIE